MATLMVTVVLGSLELSVSAVAADADMSVMRGVLFACKLVIVMRLR